MASAILPIRNDRQSAGFMSNFTESNLNFTRLQNIPNRNPNRKVHQQLPSSAPPINSVPANASGYRYITFRLGSYTRRELQGLKKRLISDLQRVRILRQFVHHYAPPLESPIASVMAVPFSGQKRSKPVDLGIIKSKKPCGRVSVAQRRKLLMRECGQILGKLMKHKHGWVFNTPVDAAAMKLYDYHNVISNPMDLGTIKSKLLKNEYESPLAFASDVRLTFENAMVYNGRGSDVFAMAERLLLMFENMLSSAQNLSGFVANQVKKQNCLADVTISVEKPVISEPIAANLGKQMIRAVSVKPVMTEDEKSEMAKSLMNVQLGRGGMKQIMEIVKKDAGLEHQGDEIELDLAVLDNDTLWELRWFMNSILSKKAAIPCVQTDNGVEEDVDIGEEMQLSNFPSVVIEKDVVNGSSSSSDSSSDSDSSSSESGASYNEHEVNSTPHEF
ncbi:transcription factor GTE7-like [Bidens hawaiensis]|uniref:transcription factor GTE7-like n=1 Tax=Bidens hawaiensis TaxID=980011 RepID=UPI00404B5457